MSKLRNVKAGGGKMPRAAAGAYTAGSWDHPDMRRWSPGSGSADSDLLPEQGTIRSRARDLSRNHGVAEGAIQTLTDNIVSSGLRFKSRPDFRALKWSEDQAEEWSSLLESRFAAYWNSTWVDAARSLNGNSLTKLAYGGSFVNGEAIGLALWLDRPGAPARTCIQIVEADRLQNPNGQPDRIDLRGGIEIDKYGAPIACWIRKAHPGERFFAGGGLFPSDSERIPVRTPWGRLRVLHLHDKERAGQTRGKPQLASVMRQFKVLGDFTNAELKAAVVNAMVAVVTKSAMGQEQLVELLSSNPDALKMYQEGLAQRNRASVDFNAGMILPLALGEDFASFTPGRPSESFEPFVLALFRQIAAGLNIPYELLLKDFSKTNYSSARAAMLEAWRFFRGRRKWIVENWCHPIFELWLEEEVNQGRIEAPDFYAQREFYCRGKWIGDGRGWVDPLKEAAAAEMRLSTGLSTLEDECAEQGNDWEEVLQQRSREQKRAKELGITLPWMADGASMSAAQVLTLKGEEEPGADGAPAEDGQDPEKDGALADEKGAPQSAGQRTRLAANGGDTRQMALFGALADGIAKLADRPVPATNVTFVLPESVQHQIHQRVEVSAPGIEALAGEHRRSNDQAAAASADLAEKISELTRVAGADRVPVFDEEGNPIRTRIDIPERT